MAARQIGQKSILFPEGTVFLDFPRTDGKKSTWPTNTKKIVDKDGTVNYMATNDIDENPSRIWRKNAGIAVAKALDMEGANEGRSYVLRGWPEGYQMFIHLKGPEKRPRNDPYLYGSEHVLKFRSGNEFTPHAIWLFTDDTLTHANCQCKYSTKKPQLAISQSMGLSVRTLHEASPSPNATPRGRPKRALRSKGVTKAYTAVREVPKPAKKPQGPKTTVLPERNNDIRDALKRSVVQPPRLYRPGEVIWCRLEHPIRGPYEHKETIEFWPGIVDDMDLKIITRPAASKPHTEDPQAPELNDPLKEGRFPSGSVRKPPRVREEFAEPDIAWEVEQHNMYKVKLLATPYFCHVSDTGALPYLAYSLPSDLVNTCFEMLNLVMDSTTPEQMENQLKGEYDFDPFKFGDADPASSDTWRQRYRDASVPYTLAVEMAKNLTCYWTPTDPFDYTFTIPALPPPGWENEGPLGQSSSHPQGQQYYSLQNALEAAMSNNAKRIPPHSPASTISGANGKTREELKVTAANLLGQNIADRMPSSQHSVGKTITQARYQGLWWGAERIWADELIRLKLARNQFAPEGAPAVSPPSGMSASTAAAIQDQGLDEGLPPEAYGAGERGLFMKIEGLFVVDIQTPEGVIKECRASGMLYELADIDWEPPASGDSVATSTGKGKERATEELPLDPALIVPPSASRPSTPVKSTSSAFVGSSSAPSDGPGAVTKHRSSTAQISSPIRGHYGLPPAPAGFKFHPILPLGHEVVLSLSLISGRYYPGILNHPLLHDTVHEFLSAPDGLIDASYLWALQGSVAGIYQSMDPQDWKLDRAIMLKDADREAKDNFLAGWRSKRAEKMDFDASPAGTPNGTQRSAASATPGPSSSSDVPMEDVFGPSASSSVSVQG